MRIDPVAAHQAALLAALRQDRMAHPPAPADPVPDAAPPAAQAASATPPPGSIAMLVTLAAQAAPPAPDLVRRRAGGGLDALAKLRRRLLLGDPDAATLAQLRRWIDEASPDEAASDLLRDLKLRMLVELAKAERQPRS